MPTARPFLMFTGRAEEAMTFYASLFGDSEVIEVLRYGKGGPGPDGSVMKGSFRIGDQVVLCTDSFVKHAFDFTPSFSLFVECGSGQEISRLCDVLSEGGKVLMRLGQYGFSRQFAWVNDRFGVSWRLNVQ